MIGEMSGKELAFTLSEDARIGDHIWWISDVRKFQRHFPKWQYEYSIEDIVRQIVGATAEREGVTI